MTARAAAIGFILLFLLCSRSAPAGQGGSGQVGIIDTITLFDASRKRDIPIKVYFPQGQTNVPLIVFSHGYGGDKEGYTYLGQGWALAGYAVILPTHHGGDRAALQARGYGSLARGESVVTAAQLADNAKDVSFVISSLSEIERRATQLAGVIDTTRIGVAGHSMGAGTALVLDGALLPGTSATVTDKRPLAFIAISPQGMFSQADAHRWDSIGRPTMDIYGSDDRGVAGEPPGWRHEPFEHMPAHDKYNLIVDGANHFSFADPPATPDLAKLLSRGQTRELHEIHDFVLSATLVFWNAYLRGDETARKALQAGKLPGADSSIGRLSVK